MKRDTFVDDLHDDRRTEKQSVQLTSLVTNRLFYYSMQDKPEYQEEVKLLDYIFNQLDVDDETKKGFEAMKKFIPRVPGELFNRHYAIMKEIENLEEEGAKTLVIGACGLTPLGIVFSQKGNMEVYDTDLDDVVECRKKINPETGANYHLQNLDLLDTEKVKEFASKLPKVKSTMLVEGLTLYLDDEMRRKFHENLKVISRTLDDNVSFVFDYYVSKLTSGERDLVKDESDPDWKSFIGLVNNVHYGQKCRMETREDLVAYLKSEGFKNIKISDYSNEDNAHTILVCDFKPGVKESKPKKPYIVLDSIMFL